MCGSGGCMFNCFKQERIDIGKGITQDQAKKMAANLKFVGARLDEAATQIERLYKLFMKVDATQIEINPFGETPDGRGNELNFS